MSEIATLLGLPSEFTHEGTTYNVVPVSFDIEGLFERWMESQARLAVERHKLDMDPAEYAAQCDGWRRDCAAHLYTWGSPNWVAGYCSPQGQKEIAFLRLRKGNPKTTAADLRTMIDRVFKDETAFEALTEAMRQSDPPSKAPPTEGGAGAKTQE